MLAPLPALHRPRARICYHKIMHHPPVQIVDENDRVIGAAKLVDVWRRGLPHRIVRVMVEDSQGRVLLQKRSKHMELYPDCWDNSVGGHVDEGETYESAAEREAQEELGVCGLQLKEVASYRTKDELRGRRLNRFNKLYVTTVPSGQMFAPEAHEVGEVRWFTKDELRRLVREHPEQITDGLEQAMREYYDKK